MLYTASLSVISSLVALFVFLGLRKRLNTDVGRPQAIVIGLIWALVATAEFWILGPYSFVDIMVDLPASILSSVSFRDVHGEFSHAIAGGIDVAAASSHTGAKIFPDELLVGFLPLWLGTGLHKLAIVLVSVSGMYVLARRGLRVSRLGSLAVAGMYSLSFQQMIFMTTPHGLGYALIPWAMYVCSFRRKGIWFWAGIVAVAAANAVSSSPTHSNLALFPAVLFSGLLLGGLRGGLRSLSLLGIFAVFLLANWGDSLFAKALVGPLSVRGNGFAIVVGEPVHVIWASASTVLLSSTPAMIASALGIVLAFAHGGVFRWRLLAIIPASLILGSLMQLFPWSVLGLAQLKGLQFTNMNYASIPLAHLALAIGLAATEGAARPAIECKFSWLTSRQSSVCFALAVAVSELVCWKVANTATLLSMGGQGSMVAAQHVLDDRHWLPAEPVRVISFPYRLSSNTPLTLGLDTFDGAGINLPLIPLAHMWQYGIYRDPTIGDMVSSFVSLPFNAAIAKCSAEIDLDRSYDLGFLRMANVGFMLSAIPLRGEGLVQVAGPRGAAPVRCDAPLGQRLRAYAHYVFNPPGIRVYALGGELPRVYAPTNVRLIPDAADPLDGLREGAGLDRRAQLRQSDSVGLSPGVQDLRLLDFALGQDRIHMNVEAPHGGVVVVNTSYIPFWTATADGQAVAVVPVNGFQIGIVIPAGSHHVTATYFRPTLSSRLAAR